jgi:hypothetical protein
MKNGFMQVPFSHMANVLGAWGILADEVGMGGVGRGHGYHNNIVASRIGVNGRGVWFMKAL